MPPAASNVVKPDFVFGLAEIERWMAESAWQ